MCFPEKKIKKSPRRCGDPPLGGHHHCGRPFAPRYSWSCRFLRNQPTGSSSHDSTPRADGKSKLASFIFNSTVNWLYIILHRDPFNLLENRYSSTSQAQCIFSKIQLSRNVDWQCTWNLLVKYGCVMEDFNVIVSKEFCALAAMLLPTVWGATPSEERCWKKFGKDLGGYCTIHKQCQPGINKPPKLGGLN